MKKYIKLFGALLLTAAFTGCIDDKGNYDYIKAEQVLPVTVKGLPERETLQLHSEVRLTPIIEGLPKSEDAYEFTWYSYPLGVSGVVERDTIGRSKTLEFTVEYVPGIDRQLVFVIRDKQTNIRSITEMVIYIQAVPIGTGYYIAKDIDNQTDIDYISANGTQYSDILSMYLGKRLTGKAVKTFYQSTAYTHIVTNSDGTVNTLSNQSAFHVLSEQDGCILNAGTLELFKTFDEMFYGPAEPRPTDIFFGGFMRDLYLMNAGNVHNIYGMTPNAGKYGDSKAWDDDKEPDLFPKFLVCDYPGTALCFDVDRRSFCYTTASATRMTGAAAQPSGKEHLPAAVNMDKDMMALLDRGVVNSIYSGGAPGWAIMKSVTQPYKYYIADILYLNNQYPFADFDELGADRQLPHAEVFAANRQTAAIYFATGNKISYYVKNAEDANSEEVELTFQQGQLTPDERVVFMDHIYAGTSELAVLTSNAGNWKLYLFPVISGTARIDTENAKVYSGTGNARHVMKR